MLYNISPHILESYTIGLTRQNDKLASGGEGRPAWPTQVKPMIIYCLVHAHPEYLSQILPPPPPPYPLTTPSPTYLSYLLGLALPTLPTISSRPSTTRSALSYPRYPFYTNQPTITSFQSCHPSVQPFTTAYVPSSNSLDPVLYLSLAIHPP